MNTKRNATGQTTPRASATPGPWHVSGNGYVVADVNATIVADVPSPDVYDPAGRKRDANARLIAAAPEMLALLREWAVFAGDDCQCFDDQAIADTNERCVPCRTSALLAKIDAR